MSKENDTIVKCTAKIQRRVRKTLGRLDPEFHTPLLSSIQLAIEEIRTQIKKDGRPPPAKRAR